VAASVRSEVLPNGFTVFPVSSPDVPFLYEEVFVQNAYVAPDQGIRLAPGDTVLDIGANIGVFTLQAASLVSPGGRVLCCEPAPRAYAALRRTLAANAADARVSSVDVRALQVAVGGTTGTALLTEYPHAAGWSTLCVDDAETAANVGAYAQSADAREVLATAPAGLRPLLALCLAPLRRTWVYTAAVRHLSSRMLRGAREVRCDVVTVSQLVEAMAAHVPGFTRVDLLKIDVERAELDVLRGITSQQHWASIRQVVMEVHDADGRLDTVMQLLRREGCFTTVTSVQPSNLVGSNLHVVYATR
jgi:FkbM family methyltransferase